ncbi:MAG: PKD domain-containing protein [Acidobacteriota bacterium]
MTSKITAIALTLALTASSVMAQSLSRDETSPALLEDAASYSELFGVSQEEAVARLHLQRLAGDLDARLAKEAADTYAGLWIDNGETFSVVVRTTAPAGRDLTMDLLDDKNALALAPFIEVQTAQWTLAELEDARVAAHHMVRELGFEVDSDIDIKTNRVEIYTVEPQGVGRSLGGSGLQLPMAVEVVGVDALASTEQLVLEGGQALTTCTGGFTVRRNSTGEVGISTAAHCGNTQRAFGTVLPFRAEDQQGNQDVQWHSSCGIFDVSNRFNSGIGMRAVVGTRSRTQQAVGSLVCKWGMTSGRTCGTIQSRNYAPSYVTSASSTFIRVDGGATNLSDPGDSGGPWFVEDRAYGIHSGQPGGDANDALYMPINYISSLGVSVLTFDPAGCNQRPTASFNWNIIGGPGQRVDFDASASNDPDGTIVNYRWDFGDGQTVNTSSPTISHLYFIESNYSVTLTVTDDDGATAIDIDFIPLCEDQPFAIICAR